MNAVSVAFEPTNTCYCFPFLALQRAFRLNKWDWKDKGYRCISAHNPGYTTVSVAVPIQRLLDDVRDAMVVQWGLGG